MLHLSNPVRQRILKKLEAEGVAVVSVDKKEPRVWGFEMYCSRKKTSSETIRKHKPWKRREKSPLGPLGSKPLQASPPLSRSNIYEDR